MQDAPRVITTKLQPPRVPERVVGRARLMRALEGVGPGVFTLVSAPAGFGKTTLVSAWARQLERGVAWLTLDAGDNNVKRFVTHLWAALQQGAPTLASDAEGSPEVLLEHLVNDLAVLDTPVTLVLDDYQAIETLEVHEALRFFLEHCPENLQVVLATREDPPLPLARWRAKGELLELRARDLRFTFAEADTLLNEVLALELSSDEVEMLESRTEGWIAGLQLAALSLQNQPDRAAFLRAFAGDDRYILDYLLDEVLSRQAEQVQRFLLYSSVLERLSAPLCAAVLEGPSESECQALLERLEQANAFVMPLDSRREWYRYHQLFAELLRVRLQRAYPEQVRGLHARAARWFAARELTAEAIRHALAAGDAEQVARLVAHNVMALMDQGHLERLAQALGGLAGAALETSPWLAVAQAWALVSTGRLGEAGARLDTLEATLLPEDEESRHILGHVAAIRVFGHAYQSDMTRAAEMAQRALGLLPERDRVTRSYSLLLLGATQHFNGLLREAAETLEPALAVPIPDGPIPVMMRCRLAEVYRLTGRLKDAEALYRQALEPFPEGRRPPFVGFALTGLAAVLSEWGQHDKALTCARKGVQLAQAWGHADTLVHAYMDAGAVFCAAGDSQAVHDTTRKLVAVGKQLGAWPKAYMTAYQAKLQLLMGDVDAVERWAETTSLDIKELAFQTEVQYLTRAHDLVRQARWLEAWTLLEHLLEWAEGIGAQSRVIELRLLQALVLMGQKKSERALDTLKWVLTAAEPEGYVTLFVLMGKPLQQLLYQALERGISPEYCSRLLTAYPDEAPTRREDSVQAEQTDFLEPLSQREREVLALMADGLSNGKIAQRLDVSLSTVKAHSYNIYSKLGVHSRMQAAAKAQRLGLLTKA